MASKPSKKTQPTTAKKQSPKSPQAAHKKGLRARISSQWQKFQAERQKHLHPHKSFRRSYREDYHRDFVAPGLLSHAMNTFKDIFKHWRTFVPLMIIAVVAYIVLVGLLSEDLYQEVSDTLDGDIEGTSSGFRLGNFAKAGVLLISTISTGGLNNGMDEVGVIFTIFIFLIIWMTVIYLLRHFFAGHHPKMRDGLYNACAPLISTGVLFVVVFVQLIPLFLVIVTYNAALVTDFLTTPFYALLYFIFASLMILLSGYLISSSLIAMIAVTAPGMYPVQALYAASDLMAGRRIKLIIRLLYLAFVIALIYFIVMMPIILIDMGLKNLFSFMSGWPIVPFMMLMTTCFVFIYVTAYLYRYYRYMLDYREK